MKNSNNIVVLLEGWTDIGFSVVSLHLVEEIGGSLAHGILELWLPKEDKPLENITNETHGVLRIIDENKGGRDYEIPIFIEKRNYLKNTITLELIRKLSNATIMIFLQANLLLLKALLVNLWVSSAGQKKLQVFWSRRLLRKIKVLLQCKRQALQECQ